MKKNIAIICEYVLLPERIGGMDRFFKAYDTALKEKVYDPIWFFKDFTYFDFFMKLNIISAKNTSIEAFFLGYCNKNDLKFDTVITHFLQPVSPFFRKVKKQMNPYIINVDHNPRPLEGFPLMKRIKNLLKGLMYGKYVDKLVGVSEYTSKHIINDFGNIVKNKTDVIYNGIAVANFKKQQLDRTMLPIKFIVVSHLRESKGIQDLLEALIQIDRKLYVDIKVDIYGDGPYKNELIQLQHEYKLENVVYFKGNSPKLNELFHQYHYMLQPTYMECFSLSILESLASNVPVITTTVGGNPEIIKNGVNGFIFEPKDVAALTKIIQDIVENKISISKDVYGNIEKNFTLDIMVENHIKLVACI